jgi:signal transduction histidine kinase
MISQPWLRVLRVAWVILAILAVAVVTASIPGFILLLEARTKLIESFAVSPVWIDVLKIGIIVAAIAPVSLSLFLAWVIFRQKSKDRMPVYLSFFLVLYGIATAGQLETIFPFWPMLSNLKFGLIIASLLGPVFVALFVLFPDGQFVPSWTRWLILLSISIVPVSYILEASSYSVIDEPLFWFSAGIAAGTLVLVLYAQIYRFRKVSDSSERQQTKWVIYGIALWFLVMAVGSVPYAQVQQLPPGSSIPWWQLINELAYLISFSFLPISLTIAILRYRLYDIDILINRTLVYGALTIITMGIYVFIVGYLGSLFQAINQTAFAFLATGLLALIFQPLRERLQRVVNRLMFGERDDPLSVLSSLSKRLEATSEPEAILPSLVETVGQALKLPYVAIEAHNGQTTKVVAEFGDERESSERLPLIHQSKTIGQLLFARRSPHESFREAEYKLLRNIARQTGAAVHAAKLTADLRRSRQQLVSAREEERRRLRRDLHDGLGPTLAGLTLRIDAARNKLQKIDGLIITIEDSYGLLTLPAAVEVAAYRIALEGITNVIRHAQAANAGS